MSIYSILFFLKSEPDQTHCFKRNRHPLKQPLLAIFTDVPKFIFGELRPNFLARCFFNETTGTSRRFLPTELTTLEFDIRDCPGISKARRK